MKFFKHLVPRWAVLFYHWVWARAASVRYRFPASRMLIVGVTGTKGKTTTAALLYHLFQSAGWRAALLSSTEFKIAGASVPNTFKMTMPGRGFLQKFLAQAREEGCTIAVVEVTSEGIAQFRHTGVEFDCAVFLNLKPEHLESHGSWEAYRQAKSKLFAGLTRGSRKTLPGLLLRKTIVANLRDEECDYFLSFPADRKIGYRIRPQGGVSLGGNSESDDGFSAAGASLEMLATQGIELLEANKPRYSQEGTEFFIEKRKFTTSLLGEFNLENTLAALSVGFAYGIDWKRLQIAVSTFAPVGGRFEIVEYKGIRCVVDYAHTPDSLERLYQALHAIFKPNRLLCLLSSAGGGRDRWKRPIMGEIASRYCNEIVLTDEDPYDEDPMQIVRELEVGLKRYAYEYGVEKQYEIILDRKEAIQSLIKRAISGDALAFTGKGAEVWMMTKKGRIPWNEKEIVQEALAKRTEKNRQEAEYKISREKLRGVTLKDKEAKRSKGKRITVGATIKEETMNTKARVVKKKGLTVKK